MGLQSLVVKGSFGKTLQGEGAVWRRPLLWKGAVPFNGPRDSALSIPNDEEPPGSFRWSAAGVDGYGRGGHGSVHPVERFRANMGPAPGSFWLAAARSASGPHRFPQLVRGTLGVFSGGCYA